MVGKEENTGNQHFLLFPQFFLLLRKQTYFSSRVHFLACKRLQFRPSTPAKKTFENKVGREENLNNKHSHLFSQCFLSLKKGKLSFESG